MKFILYKIVLIPRLYAVDIYHKLTMHLIIEELNQLSLN